MSFIRYIPDVKGNNCSFPSPYIPDVKLLNLSCPCRYISDVKELNLPNLRESSFKGPKEPSSSLKGSSWDQK